MTARQRQQRDHVGDVAGLADPAERLLRLLSLLQAQRHWTGSDLAQRLGVSARTIRADVERLRSLDYQVDASPGVTGGYRLRAGSTLPPLHLDDDEAIAVAVGLQTVAATGLADVGEHASRAAAKLEWLLPSRLRSRLHMVAAAAETVPGKRDPVRSSVFQSVAAAIERHEQLRFDYLDRHGSPSRRRAEPHRMVHVSGRWYLVGYDLDRDGWRSFRVDRIDPKTPTGPRFTPRRLPGPDLGTFVARGRMAAMWNYTARVVVDAPADVVVARIPTGMWTVEPINADTSELEAGAQNPSLLAAYLAALDLDFSVDPDAAPELAAAVDVLAARYAAATRR